MRYAGQHGIPVPTTIQKPYSIDRNLLHSSYEGGILEDPWQEPPEDMFLITVSPEQAPDRPTYVEIDFVSGVPVAIDGTSYSPATLLETLNHLAGENGIGRVDMVENRFVGMNPAACMRPRGDRAAHCASGRNPSPGPRGDAHP